MVVRTYVTELPNPPTHTLGSYDFASLPNVVMSPHRGGAAGVAESETRRMRALARVINVAVRRGGPLQASLPNRVSVTKGY
jgi:phosphoglycerate dehydrogenase-like enzyme